MIRHTLIAICFFLNKSYGDENYRLNTPIRPSSYSLIITPYFNTGDDKAFTFEGEVAITFKTNANTKEIKLHSEDLVFAAEDVKVTQGNTVLALDTDPLVFDKNYTFAYVNLQSDLVAGTEYVLAITYTGPIREDLNGFYRNSYMENGVKKWLGATQMESTHARKVFPCFDEPGLKATFKITIDRPAEFKPSVSNMKALGNPETLLNGRIRESFYPTPVMSTYLVAFLVSEFEAVASTEDGSLAIYVRPDAGNQSAYSLDFGVRVEKALSAYFGIDYYSTDANLNLDHVGLPDFRAGAMENWGLVKYREALLLYVPEESTPYFKYRVAQIMAHETTHMWFGDLVTCHWWSNTWLNEGFADYFQDYITHLIEPEVGSRDMIVLGSVHVAYDADESPKAVAITNENVNSPEEISGHFGTITYQKGGSIIMMIHHLVGDEAFKLALNRYLTENKYGVGTPDAFYSALIAGVNETNSHDLYPGSAAADVVMSSWISQPGHPLLQVDVDYEEEKVTLTQKRFYIDPSHESEEIYKIPISYTTALHPDFETTSAAFIMYTETHEFSLPGIAEHHSWVIFNIQETGFYRVNYDTHSWSIISSALKANITQFHYLNRAKIVNDLFALYYADEVEFDLLKDVLEFLKNEEEYAVWAAAVRGFRKIRNSFTGTNAAKDIDAYILEALSSIISKLGYNSTTSDSFVNLRNRMQVLELACKLDNDECVMNARTMFIALKQNGTEVSPSLRPMVYCTALRHGDEVDYEFLWDRMLTTNVANEAWVIGDALGCSNSESSLKKYLVAIGEEDSPIRTQDQTVPLTSVLSDYQHLPIVMDSLKSNFTLWNSMYPSIDSVLATIASVLHTKEDFSEFASFLESCNDDKCKSENVAEALTSATNNLKWAEDRIAAILKSLRGHSSTVTPSLTILVIALIVKLFE